MSDNKNHKTVLGADCRITGELSLDNDAVIMGQFEGTLRVTGMLEITGTAQISGTVIAGSIRLAGKLDGDLVAEQGVELLAGAHMTGHLFTTLLAVVDGAVFQGEVCVGPKAMESAAALLQGQTQAQPRTAPARREQTVDMDPSDLDTLSEEELAEAMRQVAEETPVKTMPNSLDSILARRRKTLAGVGMKRPLSAAPANKTTAA